VFKAAAVGQHLDGQTVAVKVGRSLYRRQPLWWDPSVYGNYHEMVRESPELFRQEAKKYSTLKSLQGTVIPRFCEFHFRPLAA
jgi:hypothetical protein